MLGSLRNKGWTSVGRIKIIQYPLKILFSAIFGHKKCWSIHTPCMIEVLSTHLKGVLAVMNKWECIFMSLEYLRLASYLQIEVYLLQMIQWWLRFRISLSGDCIWWFLAKILAVVVVKEVEEWHSLWAGQVCIIEWPLAILAQNCWRSVLAGCRAFLITCSRMVHTIPSSLLLPIIIYQCEIYHL